MSNDGQSGFYVEVDGVRMLGTLFRGSGEGPLPTVFLLHGIPGIEKNYDLALAIREHGLNAVIFHYRGCWGSSGAYDVRKIPKDISAVIDFFAAGSFPQVDPERILAVGHSLGGWAAVLSAASDNRIRAVAVINSVSIPDQFNLSDVEYAAEYTPWLIGITPSELAIQWASLSTAFSPVAQVQKIFPRPLMVIHSQNDEVVHIQHSRTLAANAGGHATYLEHETADHSFSNHRNWLTQTTLNWIASVLRQMNERPEMIIKPINKPEEHQYAKDILQSSGLPLEGFPDDTQFVFGAYQGQTLVGCAAIEVYGKFGLLRSVAVQEGARGSGVGCALTKTALDRATSVGLAEVYLLTETAIDFFPKFGFNKIDRSAVPSSVKKSVEFRSACPDSAVAMQLKLQK